MENILDYLFVFVKYGYADEDLLMREYGKTYEESEKILKFFEKNNIVTIQGSNGKRQTILNHNTSCRLINLINNNINDNEKMKKIYKNKKIYKTDEFMLFINLLMENNKISPSFLQRKCCIGWDLSCAIIEKMVGLGILSKDKEYSEKKFLMNEEDLKSLEKYERVIIEW